MENLINNLSFGKDAAEHEANLEEFFLKTPIFNELLSGQRTLVVGKKGSGKSAIFKMLSKKVKDNRIFLPITEIQGELEHRVIFNGFTQEPRNIDEIREAWKRFIGIKLVKEIIDNSALFSLGGAESELLTTMLQEAGAIAQPPSRNPQETAQRLEQSILNPMDYSKLFKGINDFAQQRSIEIYILIDRLDEILINEAVTRDVIDGLIVATADLTKYNNIKLILFLREDAYAKIQTHTVSHMHSSKWVLSWSEDEIIQFLAKRIAYSLKRQMNFMNLEDCKTLIFSVFEKTIWNSRVKDSIRWLMAKIIDGSESFNPRDFILFGNMAKDEQLRKSHKVDNALISSRAMTDAYGEFAKTKLEDYKRVYPNLAEYTEKFSTTDSYGKFRREELSSILGIDESKVKEVTQQLVDSGFLTPDNRRYIHLAESFEIPPLYMTSLGLRSSGPRAIK